MAFRRGSFEDYREAVTDTLRTRGVDRERAAAIVDRDIDVVRTHYQRGSGASTTASDLRQRLTGRKGKAKKMAKICIRRKGYTRKAYTRKDGTRVKAARVGSSRFCIPDPGRPGRRARGSEAGPFRGTRPWIMRSGALGGPGFARKPQAMRRHLLEASVRKSGYRKTLGRLQVLLRSTEIHRSVRRHLEEDRRWLVGHFGGPGSFGSRRGR